MKKLLAILLAMMMLLFACISLAEGVETGKPISFSGYAFGDTFKSIRSNTRLFCIDFMYGRHSARVVADALDDFGERNNFNQSRKIPSCFFARPSETSRVAGYDVETELWFIYPFQNGRFSPAEDEAIFYAGVYEFPSWNDLPAIYEELKEKLAVLYGEPYFTGDSLDPVLGAMPISSSIMDWYNSDNAKFFPEYTMWKSSVNGCMAVLSYWFDCNVNEHKLRIAYVSNYAEEHFEYMAKLGVFGEDGDSSADYSLEGL